MEEQTHPSLLSDPDFRAFSWQAMLATIPWTKQDPMDTRKSPPRDGEHSFNNFNYRRIQR